MGCKGYIIVLVFLEEESMRKNTEKQLSEAGIVYDQLVMGIGGSRVLIVMINPMELKLHQHIAFHEIMVLQI